MITDKEAQESIDFLREHAEEIAKATARIAYIDNAIKRVKAQGMANSDKKTLGDREIDAYLSTEYEEINKGLQVAVHAKEKIKWEMESHKMRFEKWRTEQFNMRTEAKLAT